MHQFHRQLAAGMRAAAGSGGDAALTYLSSTPKAASHSVIIDTSVSGAGAWCVLINAVVSTSTPSVTIAGSPVAALFDTSSIYNDPVRAAVYIIPAQGQVLLESTDVSNPAANYQKMFLYRLEKSGNDASAMIENQWAAGITQTLSLTGVSSGSLILAGSITANNTTTRLASPITEDVFEDCNSNEYVSLGTVVDVSSVAATASVRLLFAVEF
jgi:hypothetical protein